METTKKPLKERLVDIADIIDAFRMIPRLFLLLYGTLVYNLYTWYTSIETVVQESCDAALVKILVEHGETLVTAQELACQVSAVIGGPTTAQTTFVTTIVGLSTAIFGFYTNTGRTRKDKPSE